MANNITELVFVIDASGSMCHLREDTVGGVNGILQEQRNDKKDDNVLVNLVTFNYGTKTVYDRVELKKVTPFTANDYRPSGGTALYDATCETIKKISDIHKYIRKEDVPQKTLFVIITDGMENSSTKYSGRDVKQMIDEKKKIGWEFLFLGANIDTEETAQKIGVDASHAMSWMADDRSMRFMCEGVNDVVRKTRKHESYSRESFCALDMDFEQRSNNRPNKKK